MPRRAWERAYGGAQLASGVLMFSISWRGKRNPWDLGATTFILPQYDVSGDVAPHMPSTGVWYDAFDIISWATAVGRKLPMTAYRPVTAKLEASKGRNQGQRALTTGALVSPVHKG